MDPVTNMNTEGVIVPSILLANFDEISRKIPNLIKSVNFGKVLTFLKIADNKDKLLKVLQYIVKLIIVTKGKDLLKPSNSTAIDYKSFASTLSLARKLGRLGNWLSGFQDLYELSNESSLGSDNLLKIISATASIGNDFLDDWICLQKGRLCVKQPYLDTLDLWSTRLWFISVSIDLSFSLKKLTTKHDESKRLDLTLTAAKQLCDWIFCFWELANLSKYSEHVPVIAGLSAAAIGAIRGWRKLK